MRTDIFDALQAQEERLDAILSSLREDHWAAASLCPGWTVRDVVLHLAQTEEAVAATLEGAAVPMPVGGATTIDDAMGEWVRAERATTSVEVHRRWNDARVAALNALRRADPEGAAAWAAAPLKPRTLATTRLSEHWIHTLDIAEPLGISHPDTDDLRHIAWLAYRTIPYAFDRAGRDGAPSVRLELRSPGGEEWAFGPPGAECVVRGPAGEFCRVAARRLLAQQADGLAVEGRRGSEVLELVRTYA